MFKLKYVGLGAQRTTQSYIISAKMLQDWLSETVEIRLKAGFVHAFEVVPEVLQVMA